LMPTQHMPTRPGITTHNQSSPHHLPIQTTSQSNSHPPNDTYPATIYMRHSQQKLNSAQWIIIKPLRAYAWSYPSPKKNLNKSTIDFEPHTPIAKTMINEFNKSYIDDMNMDDGEYSCQPNTSQNQ
jgi:hypothetical protein